MGHIFYIMGPSSSGKDTIFKRILRKKPLCLETITMYTTRPIREGETDGVEYFFVTEEELNVFRENKQIIEERAYQTVCGIWRYFTVKDKQVQLDNSNYLMIGTVESFVKTRSYFGENRVIPILIQVDDGVRLQRALDREKKQDPPKYREMCRRYLADAEDFGEENLRKAGISKSFSNDELENCISEIEAYILEVEKRTEQ